MPNDVAAESVMPEPEPAAAPPAPPAGQEPLDPPAVSDTPEAAADKTESTASPAKEVNPASAVHGGREISNKILYIGNLHKSVDEEKLIDIFSEHGSVKFAKVLNDKNKMGFNYAFLEFNESEAASSALNKLNGEPLNDHEIKINWAYHSSNANSVQSTQPVFNIFVGDLSPEVDDETLNNQFSRFNSLKEAHVMWDMQTSRSRGYGFVTFLNQHDAELALNTMNGKKILGRNIRCNWASHKQANFKKGRKLNLNMNNPNMMHPIQHGQFQNHPLHAPPHPLQQSPMQMAPLSHPMQAPPHMQPGPVQGPPPGQGSPMQGIPGSISNKGPHGAQLQGQHQGPGPMPVQGLPGSSINMQLAGSIHPGSNAPGVPNQLMSQPVSMSSQNSSASPSSQAQIGGDQSFNNDIVNKFEDLELSQDRPSNNTGMPMMASQSYEIVLRQTPNWQTTVYLGNIAHFSQQNDLLPLLQNLGFIVDFKFHPEKGCAFVKYDTHERAAMAIVQLAGFNINGRPLKCGWGKDKPPQYRNMPPMYNQRS